jgi:hypothetical protein
MEDLKNKLFTKLKEAFIEKKKLTEFFHQNSSDPDSIEKELKIKLGAVTLKSVYIEAQILTLCNVLYEDLSVDLESELSKEDYFTFYVLKNHAAYDLKVENDKLKINPEFEDFISNLKNQIKNGNK